MLLVLLFHFWLSCAKAQIYEIQTQAIDFDEWTNLQIGWFLVRFEIFISFLVFNLELGDPKQTFQVYLHPFFDDLLVVDSKCGEPIVEKCPKYCGESA
jgi:succinate-acetate transporter protein